MTAPDRKSGFGMSPIAWLLTLLVFVFGLASSGSAETTPAPADMPNIMLIAVDDMGYDTPESFGGQVSGLTPSIDALAARGMSFHQAYNTSSRCAPSRGSMMTGLYQNQYAAQPGGNDTTVRADLETLPEYLAARGYMTGLFGKDTHYRPLEKYNFDRVAPMAALAVGRSPKLYADAVSDFIRQARESGRPFFISANTHDPHRPYAGAPDETEALMNRFKSEVKNLDGEITYVTPPPVTAYSGARHAPPGFIPDTRLAREEFATYLNSAHRADQFVGAMIDVLEDNGLMKNTLVIFLSDNGIHIPFAKANVYLASVKTPFVVYWQGRTTAGAVSRSLVSTVDLVPTILEAAGIPIPGHLPGKSLLPLLGDPNAQHHEQVFATLDGFRGHLMEMRSVIDQDHIYIYNGWADRGLSYRDGKSYGGLTYEGMAEAAKTNPDIRERLKFFHMRAPEELYNVKTDPDALGNLINADERQPVARRMRRHLLDFMQQVDDPYLDSFERFHKVTIPDPVLDETFDDGPGQPLAAKLLRLPHLALAPGQGVNGSIGLQATYEGYERGSRRISSRFSLPEPGLEYSLNYDVRLDADFQFALGGKMHGLGPRRPITGGKAMRPDGWSARATFDRNGGLRTYVYHQGKTIEFGAHAEPMAPFFLSVNASTPSACMCE